MLLSGLTAGAKKNVSVLGFSAQGVSELEAKSITELFSVYLVKSGKFKVLERDKIKTILREQSFQYSGCTESSCAVKIGKLLNMDFIIIGSVIKLGENLFVSVRQVAVETGEIIKSHKTDGFVINDVDAVLKKLAEYFTGSDINRRAQLQSHSEVRRIYKLISDNLFRNEEAITRQALNLAEIDRIKLYESKRKGGKIAGAAVLNYFIGFGLGSFAVVKHPAGGFVQLLGELTGIGIMIFAPGDNLLNQAAAIGVGFLVLSCFRVAGIISPIVYGRRFDRTLKQVLDIQLLTRRGGDRQLRPDYAGLKLNYYF
ncbi:MAG TPA: CsgG/HfaB family protein [Spirochaetota bacterium]|nr:CsgG/HfaB family protein [Spirochaetota bacterium]